MMKHCAINIWIIVFLLGNISQAQNIDPSALLKKKAQNIVISFHTNGDFGKELFSSDTFGRHLSKKEIRSFESNLYRGSLFQGIEYKYSKKVSYAKEVEVLGSIIFEFSDETKLTIKLLEGDFLQFEIINVNTGKANIIPCLWVGVDKRMVKYLSDFQISKSE